MLDKNLTPGLQLIANGVFVIGAEHEGMVRGFTATWVSQASFQNPLVMISVSKAHDTYPMIASANKFFVNVLGVSNVDLARHFGRAKSPDETDIEYFREEQGHKVPILRDALAALECNVISAYDAKDHTIFLGEVVRVNVLKDEEPLIYYRRVKYAKPQRLEETP